MITLHPTSDIQHSVEITYVNMLPYYDQLGISVDEKAISLQAESLDNWDILLEEEIIGILRLEHKAQRCIIRDLQIIHQYQNKGLGSKIIAEIENRARKAGKLTLALKVFRINPAQHLYKRCGFTIENTDELCLHMAKPLIEKQS